MIPSPLQLHILSHLIRCGDGTVKAFYRTAGEDICTVGNAVKLLEYEGFIARTGKRRGGCSIYVITNAGCRLIGPGGAIADSTHRIVKPRETA